MLETMIIRPLPLELSEDDCRKYRRISKTIRKGIQRLDEAQQNSGKVAYSAWRIEYSSFDSFLDRMQLSWSNYVLGLRASVQKATIFYERDLDAIRRTPFNPKILALQKSNMDAQFVLDPYSAATYISSYMMKSNYALGKLMKDACTNVCDAGGSTGEVMRAMGNALLNGQEISVQHAAYICIGLPFRGSSRETVFVPSAASANERFLSKRIGSSRRYRPNQLIVSP
jgi:hypothetical protein